MDKWIMCVVALLLGMLMFHMLKNVCGCKTVEGQNENIEDIGDNVDVTEARDVACSKQYAGSSTKKCICDSLGVGINADGCIEGIYELAATGGQELATEEIPVWDVVDDVVSTAAEADELYNTVTSCKSAGVDLSKDEVETIVKKCASL